MKNIYELLRQKESELVLLQKEVEALRIAARLLADDDDGRIEGSQMAPGRLPVRMENPGAVMSVPPLPSLPSLVTAPSAPVKDAVPMKPGPRQFP